MKPDVSEDGPPSSSDSGDSDEKVTNALVPALHILDSFNHRNKNQHRVARWWAQFDLLRRAVRRLNDALVLRLRNSARQAQTLKKQKSQQQQKTSKVKMSLDQDIAASVRILVDTTIPSSFLAFTQLTADNQHAALGLALLGVLASINCAVSSLVPRQPDKPKNDTFMSSQAFPVAALSVDKKQPDKMGLGVAISRDQLHLAPKPQARRAAPDVDEAARPSPALKKRRVAALAADTAPSKAVVKDKRLEKKPSKKKSKKGDEFSDLFSSLM